ncbi:hypothetical protein D9M71_818620 [compost metagenome]
MHQRAGIPWPGQLGDVGTTALAGLDDSAPTQHFQPLAQRRARDAQLVAQASLGRQRLAALEHAIDYQLLDAFGHHIGDLSAFSVFFTGHRLPPTTGRTSCQTLS